MASVTSKVLGRIETEHIKPIPKWAFLLRESFIKVLFAVNLFIGSIGFAISLSLLIDTDILKEPALTKQYMLILFLAVPVFWVFTTAFFFFVAYYNLKYTEGAYRIPVSRIFLWNLCATVIIGGLVYLFGFTEVGGLRLLNNLPSFLNPAITQTSMWSQPQNGFLAGDVINIQDKNILLSDFAGNQWLITSNDALDEFPIIPGTRIKMIGKETSTNTFTADEVEAWNN